MTENIEKWCEWSDMECPKCKSHFVAIDRYGFFCVAHDYGGEPCNWRRDFVTLQKFSGGGEKA